MKKRLLFVIFALLFNKAFSQINGDYNYSIAVRAYSLAQMPKILNQKNEEKFSEIAFKGGMLKFNDNQISYRLGGSYLKKDRKLVNNCANCQEASGKMTDYSFTIGFEKNLNFSKVQPYFGFDIGFRYNKFDGILSNKNLLLVSSDAVLEPNGVQASKSGFTATPVIGIKVNPVPQVTLFAESNLQFFYSYERQEIVSPDISNTRTLNKYYKAEFLLNPVSVGIQVNFGSNQ